MMNSRIETVFLGAMLVSAVAVTCAGCDKSAVPGIESGGRTSLGAQVDDSAITNRVKSALMADPATRNLDLKVETHEGDVTLSGFADNLPQLDKVTTVARGIPSVRTIQNNVVVRTPGASPGNTSDAGAITNKVKAALSADPATGGQIIDVVAHSDEVLLKGFVDSKAQMDKAVEIARATDGVRLVSNEISVKR